MKVVFGVALGAELVLPLLGGLLGGLAFDSKPWDTRFLTWGLLVMALGEACDGVRQHAASRLSRDSKLHAPLQPKRLVMALSISSLLVIAAFAYPLAGVPLVGLVLLLAVVALVVK